MVFHHPHPLVADATAASGIRPWRMLEAFRALGFEVDAVCGHSAERARAAAEVERRLRSGERYALVYAESSTEPTLLTDPHHLPLHPFFDFGLLKQLHARGVPIGLFYRDIYWRFPEYAPALPSWKRAGARLFYHYDLLRYRQLLDRLYVPSMSMARHIPWVDPARMAALPPGFVDQPVARHSGAALRLLYVGGVGAHYRMHALLRAMAEVPHVQLTICTREPEWAAARGEYPLPESGNVRIVHRAGSGLQALLEEADVCLLFVEPLAYWQIAAPLKLYEYIGAERPIIASAGTLAGDFVEREGIGWTLPYSSDALVALVRQIADDRALIEAPRAGMHRIRPNHTWLARARQVVEDLTERP